MKTSEKMKKKKKKLKSTTEEEKSFINEDYLLSLETLAHRNIGCRREYGLPLFESNIMTISSRSTASTLFSVIFNCVTRMGLLH